MLYIQIQLGEEGIIRNRDGPGTGNANNACLLRNNYWQMIIFQGQTRHAFQDSSLISRLPWWLRWWRICLPCRRPGFYPWVGKVLWRRAWQPTPVFFPGESHGQRSLVSYSEPLCHRVRYFWATKHDSPGCIPSMLSDPWAALCPRAYHTVRLLSVSNSLPPPHCELLCSWLWFIFASGSQHRAWHVVSLAFSLRAWALEPDCLCLIPSLATH